MNSNRNASIEKIYSNIQNILTFSESFSEIKDLKKIIKICRLKPYHFIFNNMNSIANIKSKVYKEWVDEYGNMLKIFGGGKSKIILNQIDINKTKIICTDLYAGLTIENIAKISNIFYLCIGKDDLTFEDNYFITFLGIDDYLRSFLYTSGKWVKVSPLLLSMFHLKNLVSNLDIKYYKECSNKENPLLPCIVENTWLSIKPMHVIMERVIEQHEQLLFLKG